MRNNKKKQTSFFFPTTTKQEDARSCSNFEEDKYRRQKNYSQ